jgi:multidrug efflux pump subunit AcrB
MNFRRTLVWVISVSVGIVSTIGVILLFGTTFDKFSLANAVLVFLSIGSITFVWLDYILRTQYLRS